MTHFNKMRITFLVCGVIVSLGGGFLLWTWIVDEKQSQEIKPWITYKRLLYAAGECDKYREQHGAWPSSLTQLWASSPEMLDPWSKDAWGRNIVLVPYSQSIGYGEILSYGRDGKPGGAGVDRDLEARFPINGNATWNKEMGLGLKQPERTP